MSDVLDELAKSDEVIDREIAHALRRYQFHRKNNGLSASVGYEPRDLVRYKSIEVIEKRIRAHGAGFDMVPAQDSYEAIVLRYPDRFSADVVKLATERLKDEDSILQPTADDAQLDAKAAVLLGRGKVPYPPGIKEPQRVEQASTVFIRDPAVKAFILQMAKGECQCCGMDAPFKNDSGLGYLEVHHMKPLSDGGSDRVSNAIAACPNCHRALHLAGDRMAEAERIYSKYSSLIGE